MTDSTQPPRGDDPDEDLTEVAASPRPKAGPRRAPTEQLPAVRAYTGVFQDDEVSTGSLSAPRPAPLKGPAPRRAATEPLLPRVDAGHPAPRLRPLPQPSVDPWAAAIAPAPAPEERGVPTAPRRVTAERSFDRASGTARIDTEDTDSGIHTAQVSREELSAALAREDDSHAGHTAPLSRDELAAALAPRAVGEDESSDVRTTPLSRHEVAAALETPPSVTPDEPTATGARTAPLSRDELAAALATPASVKSDEPTTTGARTAPLSREELAAALSTPPSVTPDEPTATGARTAPLSREELAAALATPPAVTPDEPTATGARTAPLSRAEVSAVLGRSEPDHKLVAGPLLPTGPDHEPTAPLPRTGPDHEPTAPLPPAVRSQQVFEGALASSEKASPANQIAPAWEMPIIAASPAGQAPVPNAAPSPEAPADAPMRATRPRLSASEHEREDARSPFSRPDEGAASTWPGTRAAPDRALEPSPQARPQPTAAPERRMRPVPSNVPHAPTPVRSAAMQDGGDAGSATSPLLKRVLRRPLRLFSVLALLGLLLGAGLGILLG